MAAALFSAKSVAATLSLTAASRCCSAKLALASESFDAATASSAAFLVSLSVCCSCCRSDSAFSFASVALVASILASFVNCSAWAEFISVCLVSVSKRASASLAFASDSRTAASASKTLVAQDFSFFAMAFVSSLLIAAISSSKSARCCSSRCWTSSSPERARSAAARRACISTSAWACAFFADLAVAL